MAEPKPWKDWSPWVQFKDWDSKSTPNSPGSYVIAIGRSIPRLVDADPTGVLDVGQSVYLRSRIQGFLKCARDSEKYGHMAGVRFAHLKLGECFDIDELWLCWRSAKDPDEATRLEGEVMKTYLERHRELPPLNYHYNWSQHK